MTPKEIEKEKLEQKQALLAQIHQSVKRSEAQFTMASLLEYFEIRAAADPKDTKAHRAVDFFNWMLRV
jgi:hypothetical protein